jgi:PleD family two-component response regulator
MDRLRSTFSELHVGSVPSTHRLSFSAGVALCSGPDDIEAAIERADRGMYSAKATGRNRTSCLEPVLEEASELPKLVCSP